MVGRVWRGCFDESPKHCVDKFPGPGFAQCPAGVHSFIHTTYNTVIHRFAVFVASSLVLLGMWVRLGWYIIIS